MKALISIIAALGLAAASSAPAFATEAGTRVSPRRLPS